MMQPLNQRLALFIAVAWALSCSSAPEETGSSAQEETDSRPLAFTHKMMLNTGQFTAEAYECLECSIDQWLGIELSPDEVAEGWGKGPLQVLLHDGAELRSRPAPDSYPDAMDFLEEVPGEEFQRIARTLGAEFPPSTIPPFPPSPPIALALLRTEVQRDTVLRFAPNRRIHEVTDERGQVFVLFAYQIDVESRSIPDFQDPDVLGDFELPANWSYASRILEEELVLDTPDVADVLVALRNPQEPESRHQSTWQKRAE